MALIDMDHLRLAKGGHSSPEAGTCIMEAVSLIAGEPFTDHPACVSPVLGAFGRALNDVLPDDERQALIRLVPLLVGTVDPAQDQVDGLRCAHFIVSEWTAEWLALVPALAPHAVALRTLPVPASWDGVEAWAPVLAAARAAAGDAARDAAGDAAWGAAGDAAWAAAGDAARDAAWDAAGDAAGDALRPVSDALRARTTALFAELVEGRRALHPVRGC